VLEQSWSGEPVTFTGRHFSAAGNVLVPPPVQQPPALWIGGNSRAARRRAARWAQGWMPFATPANPTVRTPALMSAEDLAPLIDELNDLSDEAGRPRLDVHFGVVGGGTPGDARFDPAHHREQVAQLEAIGVNGVGTGTVGDDLASALRGIEAFGEAVINA
jgi:alkanesulfonate monooxygenase SsuD/methylene tetrahydromethanopterin reductase-like flavin-dependent oxidoreductase (luciferase family)